MRSASYKTMRKHLVDKAKANKCPILGHYELTARCNLDCKMCYVHTQDNSQCMKKELTTDQWKRIFDEAIECGLIYASLSGGECLLRKDFRELYLYLWHKNVYVTVLTNGTLLTADYVEFFKMYRPDMIQITLYGSCEDGYVHVTGHKGFEKAISAISALEAAGIDVRVAVTPSRYMTDDFLSVIKLCKDNKFRVINGDIVLLCNRDDPTKDDYYLTIDEIVDLSVRRAKLLNQNLVRVDNPPEPFGPMDQDPPKGLPCNGGNCLATVTYDGKMYPCINIMLGGMSLLEMSYKDAWDKIVHTTSEIVRAVECEGCAYNGVCAKCSYMRLKDMYSGHCNTSLCELTRKLVETGVKKI